LGKVVKLESKQQPSPARIRARLQTRSRRSAQEASPLTPELKSWIDNVIVPTLVREYLASEKKPGDSLNSEAPMLECSDSKASPEGGQ